MYRLVGFSPDLVLTLRGCSRARLSHCSCNLYSCPYHFRLYPSSVSLAVRWWRRPVDLMFGVCIIFFEMRLEQVSLKRLIGAAFGSVLGHRRRISHVPGAEQGRRRTSRFPAGLPAALDDLRRPDRGRQEGRHAQPGRAGRHFRRREVVQEDPSRSWTPASSSTAASPTSPRPAFSTACW